MVMHFFFPSGRRAGVGRGGGVGKQSAYGLCENGKFPEFLNTTRRKAEQGTQTGDFCNHSTRFINQLFGKNMAPFFGNREWRPMELDEPENGGVEDLYI